MLDIFFVRSRMVWLNDSTELFGMLCHWAGTCQRGSTRQRSWGWGLGSGPTVVEHQEEHRTLLDTIDSAEKIGNAIKGEKDEADASSS